MRISAPAKVNLSLEVTGRRPDGYHDLVSVVQALSLTDSLSLRPADGVAVEVRGATLPEDNLVRRAALLLREHAGIAAGCTITLQKRIPIAAGLGGGSSDAAAALRGLSTLWRLDVSIADLLPLAAELGSDVPFFLYGGTAMVEGRGERVAPLPAPKPVWYLLVNSGLPVSTADVYACLRPEEWSDGSATRALASNLLLAEGTGGAQNSLTAAVFRVSPPTRQCFEDVASLFPRRTLVSGSGGTVFAPVESRETGERAASRLRARGYWTAVVQPAPAAGEIVRCAS